MFKSLVQNNLANNKLNPICRHIFNTSSAAKFTDAFVSSPADSDSSQDDDTVLQHWNF